MATHVHQCRKWPQNNIINPFCLIYLLNLRANGRKIEFVGDSTKIINSTSSKTLVGFVRLSYFSSKYFGFCVHGKVELTPALRSVEKWADGSALINDTLPGYALANIQEQSQLTNCY